MKNLNVKCLYEAIKATCPRAPLTYLNEKELIFRGLLLHIEKGYVKSRLYEFPFSSPGSWIENIRQYGLMLSPREIESILNLYRTGTGNINDNER